MLLMWIIKVVGSSKKVLESSLSCPSSSNTHSDAARLNVVKLRIYLGCCMII